MSGLSAKPIRDRHSQSHMTTPIGRGFLHPIKEAGVELMACKACSDNYGVSDSLEALGIEVKYMGEPLTTILKGNDKIITF